MITNPKEKQQNLLAQSDTIIEIANIVKLVDAEKEKLKEFDDLKVLLHSALTKWIDIANGKLTTESELKAKQDKF